MDPSSGPASFNSSCRAGVSDTTESAQPTTHTAISGQRQQSNPENVYFWTTPNQMVHQTGIKSSGPSCSTEIHLTVSMGCLPASWSLEDLSVTSCQSSLENFRHQKSGLTAEKPENLLFATDSSNLQRDGPQTPGTCSHYNQV